MSRRRRSGRPKGAKAPNYHMKIPDTKNPGGGFWGMWEAAFEAGLTAIPTLEAWVQATRRYRMRNTCHDALTARAYLDMGQGESWALAALNRIGAGMSLEEAV